MSVNLLSSQGACSALNAHLQLSIFVAAALCSSAFAAQAEPSARAILQHFYRAAGGSAWQHFAECNSQGTITVAGKTGTLHYVENLQNGANPADVEISGLDVKQADGNDPTQSWHQDAAGDVQVSNRANPDSIDDRYLTRRGYWQADYGGAVVTVMAPQTNGAITWDRLQFKVPGGNGFTLWINHETGCLIVWKGRPRGNSAMTVRSMA